MAGQRHHAAFRPAANAGRTSAPSRRQALLLVLALVLVAAAIAVASFTVKPSKARSFDLFHGSLLINDDRAPVSVDLASGKPSVKLSGAYTQVSAKHSGDLDVVPLADGTLLLDTKTGEFNMAYSSGYVIKPNAGVPLGGSAEITTSTGIPAGDAAYIVRTGASGTSVYLVSKSTVSSSIGGGQAKPRAAAGMDEPAKDVQTTAVSANGDLWMLVGTGDTRTVRQLSLPPGSNPGVTLDSKDHGTVSGAAAVGVSTRNDDGTGDDLAAVASSDSIRVFDASGQGHTVQVSAPSGVDAILPATNQHGGFAFLYHSPSGWSVVRAGLTGSGDALVQRLSGIDASASLAVPAQSNGSLYTIDLGSGALTEISGTGSVSPVAGTKTYPIVDGETSDFASATVIARGTRVIYNSRTNLEALTVFTDGSHEPVVVDKRDAVTLGANGADALADEHRNPGKNDADNAPAKPHIDPAQQVTDKINCKKTTQIPHIPTVQLIGRGSRSAQLEWTYPLLDPHDCAPSTYTVTVHLVSDNAPPPPKVLKVQGQTGINISGLFPDTQYNMVVTAYLNGKGTPSAPLPVRTSVEGPAAPTNVRASTDDKGNWTVSWNSCGGIQDKCVPAMNWTVIPRLCDNASGLQNAPANGHLVGDPTSHSFSMVYKGNPGLLGRGLNFQVTGIGTKGTAGTVSKASNCAYSWAHPLARNIHVNASTPPAVSGQADSRTNVTVSFTGDQNVALGGAGGQLTYQLLSGGSTVTTKGPTSDTSVSLDGIRPGQSYSVRVLVSPPRHSSASVSLPTVAVHPAVANWPALSVSASFAKGSDSTGALTVKVGGLTSADARGETFDLTDSSLNCGSLYQLQKSNFDPAKPLTFTGIDRSQNHGTCTVTIKLVENGDTVRNPAYFGGNPSHSASGSLTIPVPDLSTKATDFRANFVPAGILGAPQIAVSYQGGNSLLGTYSTGWSLQAQYKDDAGWTNCVGASSGTNLAQRAETLDITSCYISHRSATWQVVVDFSYFGQSPSPAFAVAVNGNGPQPINPDQISVTARWFRDSIFVRADGYDSQTLEQLDWDLTVTSSSAASGTTCAHTSDKPQGNGWWLTINFDDCPPKVTSTGSSSPPPPPTSAEYTITVKFTDPYGTKGTKTIDDDQITGPRPN